MYDGPYCSERMGPDYGRGSTADEMREFYGDPSNGDYDPDEVAAIERLTADRDPRYSSRELLEREGVTFVEDDWLEAAYEDRVNGGGPVDFDEWEVQ